MTDQHDDRFEHPEWWTYGGFPVMHIWPHPDGVRASVTYIREGMTVCAETARLGSGYGALIYTPPPPPDPWDGHVPEWIELMTSSAQSFALTDYKRAGAAVPPSNLPPRRFRLVPMEDES